MSTMYTHIKELAYLVGAVAKDSQADSGTTTTIVDTFLTEADDHWNDYGIYFYAGGAAANLPHEARVTDFVASTDTLTFAPALPAAFAGNPNYILLHKEWSAGELFNAINLAFRQRQRFHLRAKIDESLTIDMDPTATYAYTVPSGFYAIRDIIREISPASGNYTEYLPHEWWWINKATTRQLVFDKKVNDQLGFLVDGCKLRIMGQQLDTEPTLQTSVLNVPTGNLLNLAAAIALEGKAMRDVRDAERFLASARYYRSIFDDKADVTGLVPNSVLVEDT
jgi:hypothetical protein